MHATRGANDGGVVPLAEAEEGLRVGSHTTATGGDVTVPGVGTEGTALSWILPGSRMPQLCHPLGKT